MLARAMVPLTLLDSAFHELNASWIAGLKDYPPGPHRVRDGEQLARLLRVSRRLRNLHHETQSWTPRSGPDREPAVGGSKPIPGRRRRAGRGVT
jgi:hypothetical protein